MGAIYHHILDPRTGYPCENTLYSDTIITDSSLTADALSTVCYLMGYEAANDLIDQLENVDALLLQMTTKFTTQRIFFDNSGKY